MKKIYIRIENETFKVDEPVFNEIEKAFKEIERLNNIIDKAIEYIENDNTIVGKDINGELYAYELKIIDILKGEDNE